MISAHASLSGTVHLFNVVTFQVAALHIYIYRFVYIQYNFIIIITMIV